ncbi:MAG: peptide ABC transporter substrate-binding protein [Candidatus Latescibacteria bacterium]|nr:peptide ABC transporter substrate-binding protein [Candidatus Latescibacterota bacterium]
MPRRLVTFTLLLLTATWMSRPPRLDGGGYINSLGIPLPPDAAPPDEQVLVRFTVDNTYMERFKTSYKGVDGATLITEPLIRIDHNYDLIPAGAERWAVADDGLTWTFDIRRGMVWSDGAPFNAHDYVYSFRRGADPNTAFDAEWYYRSIKNWGAVVARKQPIEALGVRAIDDYTLQVTTEYPAPYLPALLTFSWASPRQAVQKYGDAWSTRPETSISSGPYRLKEWSKGDRIVLELNPTYRGGARPYLERLIYKLYIVAVQPSFLPAYEGNEADYAALTSQAEVERVASDSRLRTELNQYTDFMTYYLAMDTYHGVFKDKRVRQAFSHAIDRSALCRSALKRFGVPASAMLPTGFPGASETQLASIQRYDPDLARRYLAEAGYPNGRGFPVLDMWLRNEGTVHRTAAEAIQAMLKRVLNVRVDVRNMEAKVFMDAFLSHRLTLAMTSFQYDYIDPHSLLGIWMSGGRHTWKNDLFDQTIRQANTVIGSPAERLRLYQQAERILVEDVGAVFLWHPRVTQLWRPYLISPALDVNRYGQRCWRGDGLQELSTTIYVRKKDRGNH